MAAGAKRPGTGGATLRLVTRRRHRSIVATSDRRPLQSALQLCLQGRQRRAVALRDRTDLVYPVKRGFPPELTRRLQLRALPDGPDAKPEMLRVLDTRCRVHLRSASGAEHLCPLPSALGRLHVRGRAPAQKPKAAWLGEDDHPESRAAEDLTVGAMTDDDLGRIDLRRVGNVPAMTRAIDMHLPFSRVTRRTHAPTMVEYLCDDARAPSFGSYHRG